MESLRREYLDTLTELAGDVPGRSHAIQAIHDSHVWAYGAPVPFTFVPYLFDADDLAFIGQTCTTIHGILCKVIRRYLDDPSYRTLFHFSPEEERLILLPCGYDQLLPMARFDLFLDEHDRSFKFCEFNTDGSSCMSRDLAIARAISQTETFKRFSAGRRVEGFELFDTWATAFMRIYRSDVNAVETPTVAIADFAESIIASDVEGFLNAFARAGVSARFVDVRSFAFDGEHLIDTSDGTVIHAIYRRAVTCEILKHPGECDAMIDAAAAEKVCLIGHFRTTVAHSKMVSVALFDETTRRTFLTDDECAFIDAHLPRTARLLGDGSIDLAAVKRNKDAWIVKPADDYGAHGVFPGVDYDQATWEQVVDKCTDHDYIVQEFYPPHTVDVVDARIDPQDPCKIETWQSMPGCYVYDGYHVGFYNRLGKEGVIAVDHGGLVGCSFKVDC